MLKDVAYEEVRIQCQGCLSVMKVKETIGHANNHWALWNFKVKDQPFNKFVLFCDKAWFKWLDEETTTNCWDGPQLIKFLRQLRPTDTMYHEFEIALLAKIDPKFFKDHVKITKPGVLTLVVNASITNEKKEHQEIQAARARWAIGKVTGGNWNHHSE